MQLYEEVPHRDPVGLITTTVRRPLRDTIAAITEFNRCGPGPVGAI